MPEAEVDSEIELTRRRFARRQWTRRWLAWRVVLGGVLALAAIVLGVWVVWFSSVLGVTGVEVEGTSVLTSEEVRAAAAVESGQPLARLDMDAIAERVEALAPVKSVDVSRQWPDKVRVTVVERTTVAVMQVGQRFRGMDETGTVFRNYPKLPDGVPLIRASGELTAEIRTEGAAVVGALPRRIAKLVEYVDLRTVDQIDLRLRDGRTVVWGSAEESDRKAEVVAILLEQDGTAYDVTVPGRPTIR